MKRTLIAVLLASVATTGSSMGPVLLRSAAEPTTLQNPSSTFQKRPSRFPDKWKWAGSTLHVSVVEGESIDAQNVTYGFGGVESAHLTKVGTRYQGTYRSYRLCFYTTGGDESQARCRFETAIEIALLTPTRIEGRAESDFVFDCRSCTMTRKARMKRFVWIPAK